MLIYPMWADQVLLGIQQGKGGIVRWNGYGGNVQPGETPKQAVLRVVFQQSVLRCEEPNLKEIALVTIIRGPQGKVAESVRKIRVFRLELTEEPPACKPGQGTLRYQLFLINHLPFSRMMPADDKWVLDVLSGGYHQISIYENTLDDGRSVSFSQRPQSRQ